VAYAFHNVYAYGSFSIEVEGTAAMAFLGLRQRIAVLNKGYAFIRKTHRNCYIRLRKHHFLESEIRFKSKKVKFADVFPDANLIYVAVKKEAGELRYYVDTHEFSLVSQLNDRVTFDIISKRYRLLE
jgi:hypothetical protein